MQMDSATRHPHTADNAGRVQLPFTRARVSSSPFPPTASLLPEPLPPGSLQPDPPSPAVPWSGGYTYTLYFPYSSRTPFLGSLLSADDNDEEDETEAASPQGEFELGSQTPRERGAGKALRRSWTLQDSLPVSRNTIIGSSTILLQSVLSWSPSCCWGSSWVLHLLQIPTPFSSQQVHGSGLSLYTPAFARIWWAAISAVLGIAHRYPSACVQSSLPVSVEVMLA
ncbi:hypothetical protein BKA70DRAFT_1559525 [Coprinopsis sp. MPI-PUGE-AT-0042]|nr:hypothetical protein BKA70DRAFT_1559525 [Coprinopsis sp. MPI-PUGE-AT-0042]